MTRRRATLERGLIDVAAELGDEELEVLVLVAQRVCAGQVQYGRLSIRRDRRDFSGEALEEIADAVFYIGAGLVAARRHHGDARRAR